MALLDLQQMETPEHLNGEHDSWESELSVALCDSAASINLCL